jgi:hypothetical protein
MSFNETPQRAQLHALIYDYIGMNPSPSTIRELIGPEAFRTAPSGVGGDKLAGWLLSYCLGLPQPDLFIKVVTLVDAAGELVEVHQLVHRLRLDASLWKTQVLDELWVPSAWPFVDREALRQTLTALAGGGGPGAIAIEAPAGHGKRTVCSYIEQLARRTGSFHPVVTELRRDTDPGMLDSMVADLRLALRLPLVHDTTHSDAESRAVVLANRLAQEAALAQPAVWLVANVLEVTGLEAGLLRFLDVLLGQVLQTPQENRRLRVVLLSDELARLGLTSLPRLEDRHVLPEVGEEAISQWLAAAVPGKSAHSYTAATATVLQFVQQLAPAPSRRLEWLARSCIVAHQNLVGAP